MNGWLFRAVAVVAACWCLSGVCEAREVATGDSPTSVVEALAESPDVHFTAATEGRLEAFTLVAFGGCGNGACGVSQGAAAGIPGQPIRRAGRAVRVVGRGLGRVLFWRR